MAEPPAAEEPHQVADGADGSDDTDDTDDTRRAARLVGRLRRLHTVLGRVLLPGYLLYHLWEQWPALRGVEHWRSRVEAGPTGPVAAMLIALPIVLHGCVGLGLALGAGTRHRHEDPQMASLRPVRMITGGLVLLFLLYHLWHVGMLAPGPHATITTAFGRLWHDLGKPLPLVIYVVGVSAACMHVGLGLSRVATDRLAAQPLAARWAPLAVGVVVAPAWLMFMELIAFFATGEGLWPG